MLGARVPACDAPVRVDHEQGVVGNVLDEQPKTLFSFAKRAARHFLLCQVFAHLVLAAQRQVAQLALRGSSRDSNTEPSPEAYTERLEVGASTRSYAP